MTPTREDLTALLLLCKEYYSDIYPTVQWLVETEVNRRGNVGRKSEYPDDPKEQNRQRQKRYREKKQREAAKFKLNRELSEALASDRTNKAYNKLRGKKKKR